MSTGYSLFIDLFRDYFAGEEDEPAGAEALVVGLRELATAGHLSPEQVEDLGLLLGHLLSVRFGTDWDQRLQHAGPEQIRHQTLRAARDFYVALARRQPLVLVCEDLHWADSLSLDLLSLLMEALPLASLLLLCVYRPERELGCSHLGSIAAEKAAGRHTAICLRALSPDQSGRLMEALLPGAPTHRLGVNGEGLPAQVKALILEKARGNPFFIEELVRHLMEARWVYRDGAIWRARGPIPPFDVPDTVQSVILSRVDRLRPDLKQLLQIASIFGRLFRPRLLEHVFGSSDLEVDDALGRTPVGLSALNSQLSTLNCPVRAGRGGADLSGAGGTGRRVLLPARSHTRDHLRNSPPTPAGDPSPASRRGDGSGLPGEPGRTLRTARLSLWPQRGEGEGGRTPGEGGREVAAGLSERSGHRLFSARPAAVGQTS